MNSKHLALLCATAALFNAPIRAAATYSDAEAAQHIGEEATVTGKVVTVSSSGKGNTFMNFGDRFPRHTFGVVIFSSNRAAVGDVKQYEGKEVSVTGKIDQSPDQKPQIVVSRADQITLAGAANTPQPSAPVATTPMPAKSVPAPGSPSIPESSPSAAPVGKIELGAGWNSARRGGEQTRKDLARLFGDVGSAGETVRVDTSTDIYSGVSFLMPFVNARRILNLDNTPWKKVKVSTPGFPQDSFNAYIFDGVFPGGFTRLYLMADNNDQIVSVLLVDSSGRTRVNNEPDMTGYHTYNFVSNDWKAAGHLTIRHKTTPPGKGAGGSGIITVDSMLIDATDPEVSASGRPTKSSFSTTTKPRTGKVLERSRWLVPVPVVNLILRCVGG